MLVECYVPLASIQAHEEKNRRYGDRRSVLLRHAPPAGAMTFTMHQDSSGIRMVVADRSHSVMTHTLRPVGNA